MKRFKYVLALSPLIILLPFALMAQNGGLEEWEVILIGLVVSAVAQAVRWIVQLIGKKQLHKRWAYIISLAVAFVLAVAMRAPVLLAWSGFENVFEWLTALIQSIQGVIFWAALIYNIVLADLFDKLGDVLERKYNLKVRGL